MLSIKDFIFCAGAKQLTERHDSFYYSLHWPHSKFISLIISAFHNVILGRLLWHGVPEKSMDKQRCIAATELDHTSEIAAEYWQNVNSD